MKIKEGINALMFGGLLAMVVLAIALLPGKGMALTGSQICNAFISGHPDITANDGIPDYYKCAGFDFVNSVAHVCGYCEAYQCSNRKIKSFNKTTSACTTSNPGCTGIGTPLNCCTGPGVGCTSLDPSIPALFVIVENTSGDSGLLSGIQPFPASTTPTDPNSISLFGNMVRSQSSTPPSGLGIDVHVIFASAGLADPFTNTNSGLDRQLTLSTSVPSGAPPLQNGYIFTQKAVRTTQNYTDTMGTSITCTSGCPPATAGVIVGQTSTGGNPDSVISSTLYTKRLATYINNVATQQSCSTSVYDGLTGFGTGTGMTDTGATITNNINHLITYYQAQNLDHEIGHMLCLAPDNTANSHHYASAQSYTGYSGSGTGSGSIMENTAYFVCKGGVTTFYVPFSYDGSDANKMALQPVVLGTSNNSITIPSNFPTTIPNITLATQTGNAIAAGQTITLVSSDSAIQLFGTVNSYSNKTLAVNIISATSSSGSSASWTITTPCPIQ